MGSVQQQVPVEVQAFCNRCAAGLKDLKSEEACIAFIRETLPDLLLKKQVFIELMESIVQKRGYPDTHHPTLFDNELLLYMDSERLFSLRMYLWGPGAYSDPHDHNSWGVIGTVTDGYEVINYRREDDESCDGYARLAETERLHLLAGETAYTLPLSKGIHKTGNPTPGTIITLNLYGRPVSRGYLNCFDVEHNRVTKILPTRVKKELLAAGALDTLRDGFMPTGRMAGQSC